MITSTHSNSMSVTPPAGEFLGLRVRRDAVRWFVPPPTTSSERRPVRFAVDTSHRIPI